MEISLDMGQPVEAGRRDGVLHRMVPILGGTVCGVHPGQVVAGGNDWQRIASDGTIDIAARYVLALAEGPAEVDCRGVRHASPDVLARLVSGEIVPADEYYFRCMIRFRTEAPGLERLNHRLFSAAGERLPAAVRLAVHEVP
jgi:hypothetical protein